MKDSRPLLKCAANLTCSRHCQISVFLFHSQMFFSDRLLGFSLSATFVTDSNGVSYELIGFSGLGHGGGSWTYIPQSAVHTVSMRFYRKNAHPQRDSIYSISAEADIAPREDAQKYGPGPFISRRKVNVSIHGIRAD